MGLRRTGNKMVEAVAASRADILKADANALREQIIRLRPGTGLNAPAANITGLFIADISEADGADVAGP